MNKKIPQASTTFGVGNEHLALSAAEGDGIIIAGNYSQEAPSAANKDFLAKWNKRFGDTKIVHEIAVSQYQGIKLWAECVKKAGSLDREKMLAAIESGVSIEGPAGTVSLDPKTHHATLRYSFDGSEKPEADYSQHGERDARRRIRRNRAILKRIRMTTSSMR